MRKEREKRDKEAAAAEQGDAAMDDAAPAEEEVEEEDPVPEITIAHFEEAMKFARRSGESISNLNLLDERELELTCFSLRSLFFPFLQCPTPTSDDTRCSLRVSASRGRSVRRTFNNLDPLSSLARPDFR